ncbi:MAG: hypothetical protein V3V08_11255 [Nannocystaceae bacterium]
MDLLTGSLDGACADACLPSFRSGAYWRVVTYLLVGLLAFWPLVLNAAQSDGKMTELLYRAGQEAFDARTYPLAARLWGLALDSQREHESTRETRSNLMSQVLVAYRESFALDHDVAHLRDGLAALRHYEERYALEYGPEPRISTDLFDLKATLLAELARLADAGDAGSAAAVSVDGMSLEGPAATPGAGRGNEPASALSSVAWATPRPSANGSPSIEAAPSPMAGLVTSEGNDGATQRLGDHGGGAGRARMITGTVLALTGAASLVPAVWGAANARAGAKQREKKLDELGEEGGANQEVTALGDDWGYSVDTTVALVGAVSAMLLVTTGVVLMITGRRQENRHAKRAFTCLPNIVGPHNGLGATYRISF